MTEIQVISSRSRRANERILQRAKAVDVERAAVVAVLGKYLLERQQRISSLLPIIGVRVDLLGERHDRVQHGGHFQVCSPSRHSFAAKSAR